MHATYSNECARKQHESIGPDGLHIPREQPKGTLEICKNIGNRCFSGKAAILRESRLHWTRYKFLGSLQNIGKQANPAIWQGLKSNDLSCVLLLRWGTADIFKGNLWKTLVKQRMQAATACAWVVRHRGSGNAISSPPILPSCSLVHSNATSHVVQPIAQTAFACQC